MQNKAENERTLALRVPGHPGLSDAKKLVFAALGGRNWGVLEIEIIAGREESLLLARRAAFTCRARCSPGSLRAGAEISLFFALDRYDIILLLPRRRRWKAMPKKEGIKEIASNRKAFHDYFVLERFEAGIELFGTEVKSIRAGQVNLKDSYCTIREGELFVRGMHVSPYEKGNIFNRDPVRIRRLLMHKREIRKLGERVAQDGVALVPLSLYFKDSRVKVELGLCKGKKLYDKRDSDAERNAKRDMDRAMKERNSKE